MDSEEQYAYSVFIPTHTFDHICRNGGIGLRRSKHGYGLESESRHLAQLSSRSRGPIGLNTPTSTAGASTLEMGYSKSRSRCFATNIKRGAFQVKISWYLKESDARLVGICQPLLIDDMMMPELMSKKVSD